MTKLSRRRAAGVGLTYSIIAIVFLVLFASLAVDFGHVLLVRNQLQQTMDAAALAAASDLSDKTQQRARSDAVDAAQRNVELFPNLAAKPPALRTQDITISKSKSSLPYYDTVAVRISYDVELAFARFFGIATHRINASATARHEPAIRVEQTVLGTANPYLAGMPEGSIASRNNPHNSPDYAGNLNSSRPRDWRQSPRPVSGLPIVPGSILHFDSITGTTKHDPNEQYVYPDGETGEDGAPWDIGVNTAGAENGISQLRAPINALVGVFLGPDRPDLTSAPPMLDFLTTESRNQTVYQPQLKQLFFIGDGLTRDGVRQGFVVPEGATRLYLATWDFYEWNNNGGERLTEIKRPARTYLIK